MKSLFNLKAICIFIFMLLVSCSSGNNYDKDANSPVLPQEELSNNSILNEENGNANRSLCGIADMPYWGFLFSNEDYECNNPAESSLVDDVAACYSTYPTNPQNYVLVVDSKEAPCYFGINKCRIYSMAKNAWAEDHTLYRRSWGAVAGTNDPNTLEIGDPNGCDLIDGAPINNNYIYSIVGDMATFGGPCVKLFSHEIQANGVVVDPPGLVAYFNHASFDGVRGVGGVFTASGHYKIFACDPANKNVRYWDENKNSATLSILDSGIPVDIAICYASSSSGQLYIAVQNPTNRNEDFIQVYSVSGSYWTTFTSLGKAKDSNGNVQFFPFLVNLAVHEARNHNGNTIVALMMDSDDGWGIYLKQLNFPVSTYYDRFTVDFTYEPSQFPSLPEGLGIGYADVYGDGAGYYYYVGDRDPDCTTTGGNGEGENILTWHNSTQS